MFWDEGSKVKVGVVLLTKLFILRFLASSSARKLFLNKLVGARSGVGNLDYSTNRGSFFNYPKDLLYILFKKKR